MKKIICLSCGLDPCECEEEREYIPSEWGPLLKSIKKKKRKNQEDLLPDED